MAVTSYEKQVEFNILSQSENKIDLPKSNVLQFITENNTKISIRPSGTEPKIKYYISVNSKKCDLNNYIENAKELEDRIELIEKELK